MSARGANMALDGDGATACGRTPVHFVGAGSGDPELITVKGARLLEAADVVVYAGSLVNPALLDYAGGATVHDSARMTLGQIVDVMCDAYGAGLSCVRLHTGDPCLYGAIDEQMALLDARGVPYDYTPGVSSLCGAAAALKAEYTVPDVSQSVVVTRMPGRTPMPPGESMAAMASHGCTMVVFLSAGMLDELSRQLLEGGAYDENTPAAIVYRATWPDEKVLRCTVGTLARVGSVNGVTRTALVVVGDALARRGGRSRLYDPAFETGFRPASQDTALGGGNGGRP